jgi:predicted phosphodiesterase
VTRLACVALAALALAGPASALTVTLPGRRDATRFAVIGDSGTGGDSQYRVARRMVEFRQAYPFDFVLMLGDNVYGSDGPEDMARKFERPYGALLAAGVRFYAALGNHDSLDQRFYAPFNMNGDRFYSFRSARQSVRFFALDSNYMTADQLRWLDDELGRAEEAWKICFLHHPLYTSGVTHGPSLDLRAELEPIFLRHGVAVVFSGHEHVYERLLPQHGIVYFVSGAAGKLSRRDVRPARGITARAWDRGFSFMVVEIAGDELAFQTVADAGETVDAGTLRRPGAPSAPTAERGLRPATDRDSHP